MVVDSALGYNYHLTTSQEKLNAVSRIFYPIGGIIVFKIHISSVKFSKLIFQIMYYLEDNVVIHDGPGFENKILKLSANNESDPSLVLYYTPTFQCMIHFISQNHQPLHKALFRYRNVKQDIVTKMFLDFNETKIISFPNSLENESNKVAIFEISVPLGFYVNVSILNFKYGGFRISTCHFAGITTYNSINSTYKEMSTVCQPHYGIYKSHKMYSETSKIVLVIYHHEEYSKIEADILISATRCAPLALELLPYFQRYSFTCHFIRHPL